VPSSGRNTILRMQAKFYSKNVVSGRNPGERTYAEIEISVLSLKLSFVE